MSLLGVGSSILQALGSQLAQHAQKKFHHVQNEFEQLGQDLDAGNLKKAQQDFAAIEKNVPSDPLNSNSAVNQGLNALEKALQSGDLSNAQQAYAALRLGVQQRWGLLHDESAIPSGNLSPAKAYSSNSGFSAVHTSETGSHGLNVDF